MLKTPAYDAIIKTAGFFMFPVILKDEKKKERHFGNILF